MTFGSSDKKSAKGQDFTSPRLVRLKTVMG